LCVCFLRHKFVPTRLANCSFVSLSIFFRLLQQSNQLTKKKKKKKKTNKHIVVCEQEKKKKKKERKKKQYFRSMALQIHDLAALINIRFFFFKEKQKNISMLPEAFDLPPITPFRTIETQIIFFFLKKNKKTHSRILVQVLNSIESYLPCVVTLFA
jgi:hypothetical protein